MRFLIIVLLIGIGFQGSAQADAQWFIDGSNQVNPFNNKIGLTIKYVNESCPDCNELHDFDDDIFIIFEDGSHYNSRYDNERLDGAPAWKDANWDKNGNGHDIGFTKCKWNYDGTICEKPITTGVTFELEIERNSPITYLYWTNKYDEDDPPAADVTQTNTGAGNFDNVVSLSTGNHDYPPKGLPVITANHDIVIDRDITLALNVPKDVQPGSELELDFSTVIPAKGPNIVNQYAAPPYLMPNDFPGHGSAIFPPGYIYGFQNNKITISSSSGFPDNIYVNLRPTQKLLEYEPHKEVNPQVEFVLRYSRLNKNRVSETVEVKYRESIRRAHDPNFLKAVAFCQDPTTGEQYILYEGQFQNDGTAPAINISMDMKLPFDLMNKKGNVLAEVTFSNSPDYTDFKFAEFGNKILTEFEGKLPGCKSTSSTSFNESVVSFFLCMGPFEKGLNLQDINYLITEAKVWFGNSDLEMQIIDDISWTEFTSPVTEGNPHGSPEIRYEDVTECNLCSTEIVEKINKEKRIIINAPVQTVPTKADNPPKYKKKPKIKKKIAN